MPAQEVAGLAAGFANAALRYWLLVFPATARELRSLRRRARAIREPLARQLALEALEKQGNIEGAAAFAVFVPWRQRGRTTRALVAFQAVYNYVDLLAEQPGAEPVARARTLHQALYAALDTSPAAGALLVADLEDDGLLAELVERCRTALSALPAYALAAPGAREAAQRIVAFQSLSFDRDDALQRWAEAETPPGSDLAWWELAGAAGSSLVVHALIAAAASTSLSEARVRSLAGAYFPSACALHSLLDSLVDEAEDAAAAQLSLIGCYQTPLIAAKRMHLLAGEALHAARGLPDGGRHALLLTAMACSYISTLQGGNGAQVIVKEVRAALGPTASAASLVFRIRGGLARHGHIDHGARAAGRGARRTCVGEPERGVDAGAA